MAVVRDLLAAAGRQLAAAGVASPEVDARLLLAHVLGRRSAELSLLAVDVAAAARFLELVGRRAAREPLQHLTGLAPFRYLELAVGPGVFVPRPETEVMTGWAIERIAELGRPACVVELCAGSGAIAASIATEAPGTAVYAVELSADAVAWARRNLAGTAVQLVHGDMAGALPELDGTVDLVVANPPYIPLDAYESVAPEARDHDPAAALFSGQDGLDAIRIVAREAARLLRDGGLLAVEHADVQGESAPAVLVATGAYDRIRDHRDLAGRPRFATARRVRRDDSRRIQPGRPL